MASTSCEHLSSASCQLCTCCSAERIAVGRLTGHCRNEDMSERKGSNARQVKKTKRGRVCPNSIYKGPNRIKRGTLRPEVDRRLVHTPLHLSIQPAYIDALGPVLQRRSWSSSTVSPAKSNQFHLFLLHRVSIYPRRTCLTCDLTRLNSYISQPIALH